MMEVKDGLWNWWVIIWQPWIYGKNLGVEMYISLTIEEREEKRGVERDRKGGRRLTRPSSLSCWNQQGFQGVC